MGFSKTGIEPRSPALQADSLPAEPPGKPKNTGVGNLSLLQQIFLTQGLKWGLLHCRWILYQLSHEGSLTYLLRNLYAGQETTVRIGHGTIDWFQIGKGVLQGYILSLCLFNLFSEYIMQNASLDEAQAWIKIVGRSINNLRYANDTTLMAER